ncbi:MAG: aconitate hydratase AcnA [Pelagibacteraceae bacterium]|jgi:aconitate hydratase|nr:aconitate hydratase AcnA [Pelagibacteraceae bacterium]MDA8569806.1 aconitate hydratase AcnA [Candidatus Pelagibacter bacterium]MDB2500187.1 aconitate hydratase AcnA [Candidatus Pelagibacter bacterium]MDC0364099.1 aconitate hydratase AcnA [Candidatus Pelagibacter sp.]MDC0448535.1 aconitate hydratase AcnA [Candidatus Pelagibacter sp.]|tara:strand:- start:7200 stop:9869 length:2670 start_codon:yes stop_codon:yes gene_type:complete
MKPGNKNSYNSLKVININGSEYKYYSLIEAEKNGLEGISKLPKSLKVLLENLLRYEDDLSVTKNQIESIKNWLKTKKSNTEIAYRPARVLLQDYTGIPAVADLAAMREAVKEKNKDPNNVNPLSAVDLVIDHSVQVDKSANSDSFEKNVDIEFQRNGERYSFLKWGQQAFNNFRIVPPGTGICHQVNLEYLSKVVWSEKFENENYLFPDTLVGTDSHTTMVNGLSVLGWGVGGIEAEAGMLGQPISMLIPEVVGFEITNKMPEGTTATDLVLTVVKMLRDKGVVGKFVEFYGKGLKNLTLADRATIANMAPEYGATCGFFPIDEETLKYLEFSGRDQNTVKIVESYAKEQGLWASEGIEFTDTLSLDMSTVVPTISGPKRPQDKVLLTDASKEFKKVFEEATGRKKQNISKVSEKDYEIKDGSILIAAITSCTNTSNPNVLIGAGLLAKKAVELGLETKPWVKTSLAPGSQVVTDYLKKAGLNVFLDKLGFNLVGYGCTTCIGNSGPLPEEIVNSINSKDIYAVSVLSGNRNFEGRISPHIKANYLASPPLVVAYALAGHMEFDLYKDSLGKSNDGKEIYLKDIWPSNKEIEETLADALNAEMFVKRYSNVSEGPKQWQEIKTEKTSIYNWDPGSTYVKKPPFFENLPKDPEGIKAIKEARPLLILGDMVTTDHISPAGNIQKESPTGEYFMEHQILPKDYNSYGSRRGNHEVMMRGTFANIRIKNEMAPGTEGGFTKVYPEEKVMPIYDAVKEYKKRGTDLVVIGGKEYGTGSSRDWAAKGTKLLGVKVVIAESFERIHRSNLIGMGVLPLQFTDKMNRKNLNLIGSELITIIELEKGIEPSNQVLVEIKYASGDIKKIKTLCRIDTKNELEYYKNGGILQYVLRKMM